MSKRRFVPMAVIAAALLLVAGFLLSAGTVTAQSATPMAGMDETPHPVHIHAGTCDTLGDVVFPLTNLTAPGSMMASPMAGGMMSTPIAMASPMASMGEIVSESTTTVNAALADIIAGGHAINAHESVENIQNYIACGNVTGTPVNNQLQITLDELNGSGYQGLAVLMDNGDGTTTVIVVLSHTMGGSMATPTS